MKFLLSVFIDAIVALTFIFGVALSDEHLLNIGYFTGWFFGLVTLSVLMTVNGRSQFEKNYQHRSLLRRSYDVLTDVAFVVFSAWCGWFVLAAIYALSSACKAQIIEKQEARLRNIAEAG